MGRRRLLIGSALTSLLSACTGSADPSLTTPSRPAAAQDDVVALPAPDTEGGGTLARALATRRSVRDYGMRALTEVELSQLLWAAQGVTDPRGYRTAPSAGATFPLETYLLTAAGLFHYRANGHTLRRLRPDDLRPGLAAASAAQMWMAAAPALFVFADVAERTAGRYGERARRYIDMEAGHAAQSLLLQAVALGLGAVPIGAFEDERVAALLALPEGERPLYIVSVGPAR